MKILLILAAVTILGVDLYGQTNVAIKNITEAEFDCTFERSYFTLEGEARVIQESEDFIDPQITYKGRIPNTSISVLELLTMHETNHLMVDSASNIKYSIRGDIYASSNNRIFASYMGSIDGIDDSMEIWRIINGIPTRVFELRNPDLIIDDFCWVQGSVFKMKYRMKNKINLVEIKMK